MKKFIKLVLPIVLILAVVFSFGACSSGKEEAAETPENSMAEEMKNDGTDEIEEQSGEQLSASCDYILAQATDSKGNYIELVANDSETYDGSQSIGLIKNNKWVIEMTDDSPIIEDGVVVFFNNYKLYKRSGDTNISFITDNCIKFHEASKEFFWNYKTGKTCEMKMNGEDKIVGFTGYKEKTLLNEKYIIIMENAHSYINSTCKIFDTDTMQFAKVFDTRYFDGGSVQVFSEGLFFARRDRNADSNAEVGGFYDINGNLVIDFSKFEDKYKINRYPERFIDGKTSFRAKNASGKEFEITIDKQGNVLSETAV